MMDATLDDVRAAAVRFSVDQARVDELLDVYRTKFAMSEDGARRAAILFCENLAQTDGRGTGRSATETFSKPLVGSVSWYMQQLGVPRETAEQHHREFMGAYNAGGQRS